MNKIVQILIGFVFVLSIISCNKENDSKNNEESISLRSNSLSFTPSIFDLNGLVPLSSARNIAKKMNYLVSPEMRRGIGELTIKNEFTITDTFGVAALYIFNFETDGYAVISADERIEPICAIVEKGEYKIDTVPSALLSWFDVTIKSVELVRQNLVSQSLLKASQMEWVRSIAVLNDISLLSRTDCCPDCPNYPFCLIKPNIGCGTDIYCYTEPDGDPCGDYVTTTVGPLMTTAWGQGCGYNDLCPDLGCDACWRNDNAWTGCVATSMSQVLRYWEHPESHMYNYSMMPDGNGNSEVQRLMHDAGLSVDMDYDCDGSGANSDKIPKAFTEVFNYSSAQRGRWSGGSHFTVINNIDANRPVILDGCRTLEKFLGLFT